MATYVSDEAAIGPDPRLIEASREFNSSTAESSASRLNEYGSKMGAAERQAYENLYSNSVKQAKADAAALGVAYKAPDVNGWALDAGKVVGTGKAAIVTAGNDLFQTVDGYGKKLNDNLSLVTNSVKNSIGAAKNWLFNTDIAGMGTLNEIGTGVKGTMEQAAELSRQVTSAVQKPITQVKGMTDELMNSTYGKLDDLNAMMRGDFLGDIDGGSWSAAWGTSVKSANDLVDSFNSIKRQGEETLTRFKDAPAELALRLSMLEEAGRMGLTDMMKKIGITIKDDGSYGDYYYHVALIDQMDTALSNGNLDIIDQMVAELGIVTVLNRYPDAVQRILRGYRFPSDKTYKDYPECRVRLLKTLNSINPRWEFNPLVANKDVISLTVFYGASESTQEAFRTDINYNRRIQIAKRYTSMSVPMVSMVKMMYPYAAMSQ